MKLVMTDHWCNTRNKLEIAKQLNGVLAAFEYDGLATKEIVDALNDEENDVIIVTADSRFMRYVRENSYFKIEDTYIYSDGKFKLLQDTTKRILRYGHNMMNLYESDEFQI
ncbi:hypothetical protein ABNX05_11245 [Lysinibacillus sp. M3]|uniref:DUF5615 domain-containing protein n=1 Tax=Lysinibacillus zambalensis TaxID=3160866 RepID=A0ABV1MTG6_9BACI